MTLRRLLILLPVCFAVPLGCNTWRAAPGALPTANHVVLDQLVVYSDAPLPQHHRLLEELRAQRAALAAKLALPISDEPIHVYLFPSAERFKSYLRVHYPDLPDRRAFFVESDTRLLVYAYWGDHVAEDLRHEVAHGYLHSVLTDLPLWLDEGLAEYFEPPRGNRGLNQPHVDELQSAMARGWRPDLRRLEGLRTAGEMTQLDYAESWAWVYYLLETTPENQQLIRAHLQTLRRDGSNEALSAQIRALHLDYERRLVEYIHWLSAKTTVADNKGDTPRL